MVEPPAGRVPPDPVHWLDVDVNVVPSTEKGTSIVTADSTLSQYELGEHMRFVHLY